VVEQIMTALVEVAFLLHTTPAPSREITAHAG
jgi:hypothetical protein